MEMESLDGTNLFFPVLAERPMEAPAGAIENKVCDGELEMNRRNRYLLCFALGEVIDF